MHVRQLTCQRRVINASKYNLFFMGKQLKVFDFIKFYKYHNLLQ